MSQPRAHTFPAPDAIIRRQMLLERLLVDVVGVPWSRAHREAERIGPAVSARVEARIVRLLDDPGTCPHGNPIPGSTHVPDQGGAIPLADADGLVSVTRIADTIEEDVAAMELLERIGLIPGRLAEVVQRGDAGVQVIGSVSDGRVPDATARGVFVTPSPRTA